MVDDMKVMLQLIVPRLTLAIIKNSGIPESDALTSLYSSELYRQLERDETKLWHLSVPMLYEMFREEQETGHITYPEEA